MSNSFGDGDSSLSRLLEQRKEDEAQLQSVAISRSRFPPSLAVGHKYFFPLPDTFAATPDAHAELALGSSAFLKNGIRFRLHTAVIVDESRFVAHELCIDTDTDTVLGTE